jgi:hypothetical protein
MHARTPCLLCRRVEVHCFRRKGTRRTFATWWCTPPDARSPCGITPGAVDTTPHLTPCWCIHTLRLHTLTRALSLSLSHTHAHAHTFTRLNTRTHTLTRVHAHMNTQNGSPSDDWPTRGSVNPHLHTVSFTFGLVHSRNEVGYLLSLPQHYIASLNSIMLPSHRNTLFNTTPSLVCGKMRF